MKLRMQMRNTHVYRHNYCMCTCDQAYWVHMHTISDAYAWILEEYFNVSHYLRLEPLPLCSYHSISLNHTAVTMMTWWLPFYPKAVCHLKASPPKCMRQKHKINRVFSHKDVHNNVRNNLEGRGLKWDGGVHLKQLSQTWPWHWVEISKILYVAEAKWFI